MWIRSQDKERLIDCTDIYFGGRRGEDRFVLRGNYTEPGGGWVLGEYKSKERCSQIMDDLEKIAESDERIVYQMPKE